MNRFTRSAIFVLAGLASTAHAAELTTTFASNNSQNGNMFDVVTLGNALTVTGLSLNLETGTHGLEIFTRNGSWVGAAQDASAWVLLGTGTVTSAGPGAPSFWDVADFSLNASSITGFYITTTTPIGDGLMKYTNGTAVGSIAAQNQDLQILEGAGKEYPFSATFEPRIWNGTIHYEVAAVPEPSTYAMLLAGLGMTGLMVRRRKQLR